MRVLTIVFFITSFFLLQSCKEDTPVVVMDRVVLNTLSKPLLTAGTLEDSLLISLEIDSTRLSYSTDKQTFTFRVPSGKPLEVLAIRATQILSLSNFTIIDAFHNTRRNQIKIKATQDDDTLTIRIRGGSGYYPNTGSISLILLGIENCTAKSQLDFLTDTAYQFNYLIPSWTKDIDSTISILSRYGGQIVVQIPLESRLRSKRKKTPHTIYVDNSPREISEKVATLLSSSSIVGVASYGGDIVLNSKSATASLMKTLHSQNLSFYDLRTNQDNLAHSVAAEHQVSYSRQQYVLKKKSVTELTKKIQYLGLAATKRKSITVWATATPQLLEALDSSQSYLKSIGISLTTIQN